MLKKYFWLLSPDTGGGNSTATDPQAGGDGNAPQPQAGDTTSGEPQAGEPQSKPQKSADDYERMIADLRKENASHRTRLKAFEDEEKKRKEAQLSEQQKLEKRLAEAQQEREQALTRAQERITAAEIRAAAADLGFADPQDAARLIERAELEYDDDGVPTNARALLEKLAKAKSYLLKQQAGKSALTSGGATNPSRSSTSGSQTITRDYVNSILRGGNSAWNALSPEEQGRISAFIKAGGLRR